jgi:hypothetical protein
MELYNKKGEKIGYKEACKWWLEHYRGLEHLHNNPEIMYTITSILGRCFKRIQLNDKRRKVK